MTTIVCIDFGTSSSKVGASVDGHQPLVVPLGTLEGDPVREYTSASSALLSSDGNIYLGCKAIEKSLERGRLQPRLDSLKRRLTSGERNDLATVMIPRAFNGTGTEFSVADILALMFGHILRWTHRYLAQEFGKEFAQNVTYRFTRPVFDAQDAAWVDTNLRVAIAKALLIEQALPKNYAGSIECRRAKRLLDSCSGAAFGLKCIEARGLAEPVAAGMFHLSEGYDHRSLALIVDIGAGTTDIAFFVAIQPDGHSNIDRVRTLGVPVSSAIAGDSVDALLKRVIAEKAGRSLRSQDETEIDMNIRRWKEDLFNFQEAIPTLSGGRKLCRVTKHEFVAKPSFAELQRELLASVVQVLGSAGSQIDLFATASQFPHSDIEVIPCGGGARLPVFDEISRMVWTSQPSRRKLGFKVKNPIPENAANFGDSFPQLAVALGGALEGTPRVNEPLGASRSSAGRIVRALTL